MKVIYILWLRQLKRYIRSKSRIVGSLAQPLLFLVALGFGFGPIFQKAGSGNYLEFLAPGIISMSILFTAMFSGIEIIWDKQFGFLKETLVAPVSRLEIMIGRTLGGATVAALQGLIVLIISTFIGFKIISFAALPLAFVFMFLIALLFAALGTTVASITGRYARIPINNEFFSYADFFLVRRLVSLEWLAWSFANSYQV